MGIVPHIALDLLLDSLRTLDERTLLLFVAVAGETAGDVFLVEESSARYLSSDGAAEKLVEALLQTYLFAGFPAAIEALKAAHRAAERCNRELRTPLIEQYDVTLFERRGTALFERIYGEMTPRVRTLLDALSPQLHQWTIIEGYGKVLSRPTLLTLIEREMCAVVSLIVGGWNVQLRSHMQALVALGVERNVLSDVLDAAAVVATPEHLAQAQTLVDALWQ
ncbi:MAG: hypothetical protein N2663_04630 [Chlorobi bacterium]|nr:hypothetical protein [Chlorobiota bacterium]